jgi:hypothetical protein
MAALRLTIGTLNGIVGIGAIRNATPEYPCSRSIGISR